MKYWNMEKPTATKSTLRILFVLCVTLIVYLFHSVPVATSGDSQIMVPNDLQVILVSAGLGINRAERATVTIRSNGNCEYWEDANIVNIDNPKKNFHRFTISKASVARIYEAVTLDKFFDLKNKYRDPEIHDGDLVSLTVTANRNQKQIVAENIGVNAVDRIALSINAELPESYKLRYNALEGFTIERVDR